MSEVRERLIIFTRYPAPGQVKTRLIPALGPIAAASLQRRLTLRALRVALAVHATRGVEFEIRFAGADELAMRNWLGDGPALREQSRGDLGERMLEAFETSFREGSPATIIIGSDCPELTPQFLIEAFAGLSTHPVVLGPANDGGYYLLGLKSALPQLFRGIPWGSDTVLAGTIQILRQSNLAPKLLPPLNDIDRPHDLALWHRIVTTEEADLNCISVIIPALNEAAYISQTVTVAVQGGAHEVLVVDAGSLDGTGTSAQAAGATLIHSQPGRARQMNTGAARAAGSALLFLHADTLLPPGYRYCVAEQLRLPGVVAGAFAFQVSPSFAGKNLLERAVNLRSHWRQMPYGDQGLFLRRSLFEELGGFAPMPIMEDYEFVRRLRRQGRVVTAPLAALTSGRRWQRLGIIRATLINQFLLAGFHLGLPLEKLATLYRQL